MSIASKLTTLNSLKDRIRTKLINLGLMSSSDDGLTDCTEALEDIEEVTPFMMSQAGVTNVAGYKYAQIDQTAWVPAGTTPSGLVSVVSYLGANGLERNPPTSQASIGTVYPPSGAQGIYANELKIDTDVIKASNIKNGVSILGVAGTLGLALSYGQKYVGSSSTSTDTLTISDVPFSSLYQLAYVAVTIHQTSSSSNVKLISLVAFSTGSGLPYVVHIKGDEYPVNMGFSLAMSGNNLTITNTSSQTNMFYGQYLVRYGYYADGNLWSD